MKNVDVKDRDYVRRIEREFHNQKLGRPKFNVVKLPCGHNVELLRPKDQYIKCHFCSKQFLYVHAMGNKRLYQK